MCNASETQKDTRVILVRSEVTPKYIQCKNCGCWENFRRHPKESTEKCRKYVPKGYYEMLGASLEYRGKFPITFHNEGCWEGIAKPPEEAR